MIDPTDQDALPIDFDSEDPIPECPMRNDGEEICESCQ